MSARVPALFLPKIYKKTGENVFVSHFIRIFAPSFQIITTMAKYLNPKADLTFKKIFGEHPHLVISLLNALLPLKDDERVESIEYWPAEKGGAQDYRVSWEGDLPRRTEAEKNSIVDVCCRDNKKREFIVEMQMTWTESFKKRVLLNASKAYVAQSEVGQGYRLLQPVYALNFVNAPMNLGVDGYYHHYQLVHQEKSDEVIDGLQLVFIELPKFQPQTFSEKKMQVLWLRFLTEINEKTLEAPAEMLENPEVSEALKILEVAAYTPAEMRAYDKFWDGISSDKTIIEDYEYKLEQAKAEADEAKAEADEAKAEAEEAKAEAEEAKAKLKQKDIDTARKLKAINIPATQIAEITSLTIEQIEAL